MSSEPAGLAPTPETIDYETWPRRDHYEFFLGYTEPFFSLTAEVDCTALVRDAKERRLSPTLRLWHGVLEAANSVEPFRLRIIDGRPVRYPAIHLSPTVMRPDETFTISFVPYSPDFEEFERVASKNVQEARQSSGLNLDPKVRRIDLIHFSTIPWFRFTSLSHARDLARPSSETKITLGRFQQFEDRYRIPVSVTAHHSLVDGLHVARFLEALEKSYDNWPR